jgi:hypothetical protein
MEAALQSQANIHYQNINVLGSGSGSSHASLVSDELRNSPIFQKTVKSLGEFEAEILSFLRNEFSAYGYRDGGGRNGHDWEEAVKSLLLRLGVRFDSNVRAGKSEVDFLLHTSKGKFLFEVKLARRDNHDWQVEEGRKLSQKLHCHYIVAVGQVEVASKLAAILS